VNATIADKYQTNIRKSYRR